MVMMLICSGTTVPSVLLKTFAFCPNIALPNQKELVNWTLKHLKRPSSYPVLLFSHPVLAFIYAISLATWIPFPSFIRYNCPLHFKIAAVFDITLVTLQLVSHMLSISYHCLSLISCAELSYPPLSIFFTLHQFLYIPLLTRLFLAQSIEAASCCARRAYWHWAKSRSKVAAHFCALMSSATSSGDC